MKRLLSVSLVAIVLSGTLEADNWAHFRGPQFNGSSPEKNLPTEFSRKDSVWSVDLPGPSAATPIVWGDHVFVSSTDPKGDSLHAICVNRKTGKIAWQHKVGEKIRRDQRSTFAAPSPTTDGKLVYFFYGNGELIAYNFAGERAWRRNIQKDYGVFAFGWTFATSPLLYEGKLYLQVLQRDVPARGRGFKDRKNESYLLAMDPKTGKTLFKENRPSQAVAESREAFTSPVPFVHNGRKELLLVGGDDITGHDPATGKELWRWGTWNPTRIGHWRLVPSPVAREDVILVCAPKRDPIYAVKAGGKGKLSNRALAWVNRDKKSGITSDVPTPAYAYGDFFILSDVRRYLSRVDPKSGIVKWRMKTPGSAKFEASPLVADGKVYLINFDGTVVIVNAETGELLNQIDMDERGGFVRSAIAAAQGQLFIRTNDKLFCVAK